MRVAAISILLVLWAFTAEAQRGDTSQYFNPLTDDITDKIPPLQMLIDSAVANSPDVQYQKFQQQYDRYEIKSTKRDILEHFRLQGQFTYGNYTFLNYQELSQLPDFYLSISRRGVVQGGLLIQLPFASVVDRKNRIKKQKKLLEQSIVREKREIRTIRQDVIRTYNQLVQLQRQLRISNEYEHYTMVQMEMAEHQFKNGEIDIAEYTRLKEIQKRGNLEYEQIRGQFITTYDILQELVGINFNLINEMR